jgi:outer membrane receptor protein involved in Fe transport
MLCPRWSGKTGDMGESMSRLLWGKPEKRRTRLFGASLLAILLASGAAKAATAADAKSDPAAETAVQQITVEATRREATDVLSVPLAVDAYSGTTLERLQVTSVSELAKLDPSLDIQTRGAADERIIIRGVSSDVGATTGIYLDETTIQGGFQADVPGDQIPKFGLVDIDHVEVLKGPQGTLFGAGSMDGTLRLVTRKPDLKAFGGWVDGAVAGVESGNALFEGSGALNLPVVKDSFGLRFVGWGEEGGGYVNQVIPSGATLKHVNDVHRYGFRVEALWAPTDRFSLLGTASYQYTSVDGAQTWNAFIGGLQFPNSPFIGPLPPYNNLEPARSHYFQQFQLYSLTARYHLDFGNIIENYAYGYKNELNVGDTSAQDCVFSICEGSPSFPANSSDHPWFWYTAQDLRFASTFDGPFQIVAGVYYEHDHHVYQFTVIDADPVTGLAPCYTYNECNAKGLIQPGPPFFIPGPIHNFVQFSTGTRQTTDQYAIYTQGDYKILPNLTLTVGFRWFAANIANDHITNQNIAPTVLPDGSFDCGYVLGCVTIPFIDSHTEGKESQPSYNFALLWAANPDVSFYVRAASGFRLGGLNEAATIAAQAGIPIPAAFGPDRLWDYEGGVKAYFMQRRLYVDLTVYHLDWTNEQETAQAEGVFGYVLNAGKSTIDGVEAGATFRPTPDLTFSGGVTYVDATLATELPPDVEASGTPGHKGDRLPFVPRLTASGQAQYEHHLTDAVVGYVQANFTYHGDSFTTFEPSVSNFDTRLPPYFLLDMRAGVRWGGDRYDAGIFAENLTNDAAWESAVANNGGVLVFSPRPRTVGLRLRARF